jgi:hypothetical protein
MLLLRQQFHPATIASGAFSANYGRQLGWLTQARIQSTTNSQWARVQI